MAAQLGGTASFQPTIFLKTSKNLSTVFISLSVILLVVLSALIVNDFIQYEITELTVYTTEKITVIVYVSILIRCDFNINKYKLNFEFTIVSHLNAFR